LLYIKDRLFRVYVDKLYSLVLRRRLEEQNSQAVKRYNQILDDLNEHTYIFKDNFGMHRIKVDESDMNEKSTNNQLFFNKAMNDL
jgi:hypothetical protein